jgi:hypothetical protein
VIKVIASDAVPENTGYVISGPPSSEGDAEIKRRTLAGEPFHLVLSQVLAREGKVVKVTFSPATPKRKGG